MSPKQRHNWVGVEPDRVANGKLGEAFILFVGYLFLNYNNLFYFQHTDCTQSPHNRHQKTDVASDRISLSDIIVK